MATVIRPPLSTRIERRGPGNALTSQTEVNGATVLNALKGQDQFFNTNGQPPANCDWPVPRAATPSITLKTWTDPLKLNLLGKDTFFSGPGSGPDYDWPNPTLAKPNLQLRTWSDSFKLSLLGKDKFFAAAGMGPSYDWPNPRGYVPAITQKTHTDSYKLELIGKDTFFTGPGSGPDYDWPNPTLAKPNLELRTWNQQFFQILQTLIVYPSQFGNFDWPNPRAATPAISLKTFTDAVRLNLLGQDSFFSGPGSGPDYDYPNPSLGKPYPTSLRTFLASLNPAQDTFFGAAGQPPANLDWPLPNPGKPYPQILRTFTDPLKLLLQGQDQFFGPAGFAPRYDYPNPTLRKPDLELRTWLYQFFQLLETIIVYPSQFGQFDWPNPRGAAYPQDLRTFLDQLKLNLRSQDQFYGAAGQPPLNWEWPVPKGKPHPQELRTFTDPLKLNLQGQDRFFGPAGVGPQYDYPNPVIKPPNLELRTFLAQFLEILNIVTYPQFNYDWPNPKGKAFPQELRTFVDDLKVLLASKDQFFGPAGLAPTYDWPVPKGKIPASDLRTWIYELVNLIPLRPPASGRLVYYLINSDNRQIIAAPESRQIIVLPEN